MTMPNASRAATQKIRAVTAIFTQLWKLSSTAGILSRAVAVYCPDGVPVAFVAGVSGPATFGGIFSFCPTTILSVLRLLRERRALIVVPNSVAIFVRLSPDLTVYICSPPGPVEVAPLEPEVVPVAAETTAAGMLIFCPILSLVGSTPGLASIRALTEMWNFLAMLLKLSPLAMTYSVAPVMAGGGVVAGRLLAFATMSLGTTGAALVGSTKIAA